MRPRLDMQPRNLRGDEVIIHGLALLLLITLIVCAIVALIWYTSHRNSSKTVDMVDPIDIAKVRFAKGEITKTEFQELKKELKD